MVHVLLVDGNATRAAAVDAVVRFQEHQCAVVEDGDALKRHLNDSKGTMLALVTQDESSPWQDHIATLWDEAPELPVFLLAPGGADRMNPASAGANVLGVLDLPLREKPLNAALKQAGQQAQQADRPASVTAQRLVGQSRPMKRVQQLIDQVAGTEASVLILGESGTGKEVVARAIHARSARKDKPFVPINCGAIPADLLESELFGHEKGAFTGAITARQGRFELAQGGTLFLDEIGDMSLNMQVKLLRVLQERTFERVGSNKSMSADVRVIAATHRNLESRIQSNEFREDLFYRLNVFPIDMPPLRERASDIPILVEELVRRIEDAGRGSVSFSPAAVSAMSQYPWPGNVRELANMVERMAILHPFEEVALEDLPEKYLPEEADFTAADAGPTPVEPKAEATLAEAKPVNGKARGLTSFWSPKGINLKETLADIEVNLIEKALGETEGVVSQAAKLLGLRRTTLVEKLRKYGLQRYEVS